MASSVSYSQVGSEVQELPPIGQARPDELRQWVDDRITYRHPLRIRDMATCRRAELYDQGMQWLMRAFAGYESGAATSQWVQAVWDRNDPNWIPTPCFNEGLGARQNESARLASPNPRPKITPRSKRPEQEIRQGSKLATDIARHRLREMGWEEEAWRIYLHMPLYGGAWVKSEWEQAWDKTTMVPVMGAMACPRHPAISGSAPGASPEQGMPPEMPPPPGAMTSTLCDFVIADPAGVPGQVCPHCPDHPPLQPFQPSMQEAVQMKDAAGMPLGREQALGDWNVSVPTPYDMFVARMGIRMRFGKINQWVEVHTETLDWIAERWPEKAADVKPESAAMLARFHPIAGAPDIYHGVMDSRIFHNSARVKEWHKAPWTEKIKGPNGEVSFQRNQGRSVVMVGDVVLRDEPFMLESATRPGKFVPRIHMEYIPWEMRDGGERLQGLSLWEILFDAQDSHNEIKSQTQAVRQRLAVPLYIFLRRHNPTLIQSRGGIPGRAIEIEPDEMAPLTMPQLINNQTIDSGVNVEDEAILDFFDRASGRTDVERGNVSASMPALAIRLLKGASSEGRQPRVDRVNQALKRIFKHGSQLQAHMYVEPREYRYEDEDGEEAWNSAKGIDIEFETDVEIEAEPAFDEKAQTQETVKNLVDSGLLDPRGASGLQRRKILVHMDVPKNLLEEERLAEASAQREWKAFREEQKPPRIDPGLDSHRDHFEDHGIRCHTAFFRNMEEQGGWEAALQILGANWDQRLQILAIDPQTAEMSMQQPNMPPIGLENMDLQDRVMAFWSVLLTTNGFQPQNPDMFGLVVQWRAHMAAHKLHEEMAQMQAQAGPTLAQPGGEETASGGQPTPGQAPVAGAPV